MAYSDAILPLPQQMRAQRCYIWHTVMLCSRSHYPLHRSVLKPSLTPAHGSVSRPNQSSDCASYMQHAPSTDPSCMQHVTFQRSVNFDPKRISNFDSYKHPLLNIYIKYWLYACCMLIASSSAAPPRPAPLALPPSPCLPALLQGLCTNSNSSLTYLPCCHSFYLLLYHLQQLIPLHVQP